ncbi:UNVERIFIED_CONTAM: hypothetical protein FKN15_035357 [Acipenser sinensis]
MTEMLMKNESVYSHHQHPNSNHPATGFYSSMGKSNVLPQNFDRFFENTYCGGPDGQTEVCLQKNEANKLEPEAQVGALTDGGDPEKDTEDEEENTTSVSSATASVNKEGNSSKTSFSSR